MLTLNLIRKCYITFVLKALQKSKSMQVIVQNKKYPNLGSTQTKIALPHKGDFTVKNPAISVYLFLCDCLPSEQNVFIEYKLRIRDQIEGKYKENRGICFIYIRESPNRRGKSKPNRF